MVMAGKPIFKPVAWTVYRLCENIHEKWITIKLKKRKERKRKKAQQRVYVNKRGGTF